MPDLLRYGLVARARYRHAAPVPVGFRLENLSGREVFVLKWYTPFEGIKGDIFRVTCDGVDVPYEGRMMKRGAPQREDYLRLAPRESQSVEFDLSSCYGLPRARECRLAFKGRIHDLVFEAREVPRAPADQRHVDISGDTATFEIE